MSPTNQTKKPRCHPGLRCTTDSPKLLPFASGPFHGKKLFVKQGYLSGSLNSRGGLLELLNRLAIAADTGANMKRILIALALTGATLSIIPTAAAQEPATVTTVCTEYGTALLPPGPPPKNGELQVIADGQVITTVFVPGPCHAPGFVLVAGS